MIERIARDLRNRARRLRVPGNPLYRVLAWEYQLRSAGLLELARILYYQPMFETLCERVGEGFHLELVPTSKLPAISNVAIVVGERARLSAQTTVTGARRCPSRPRVELGDDSYVGYGTCLHAGRSIRIGRHVLIAAHCYLSSDPGHPVDAAERMLTSAPPEVLGDIIIEDHAWLALGSTVLGNVRIGEGAIVGARAVVTRDVPPYTLVAGNPARVVRELERGAPQPSSARSRAAS